MLPYLLFQLSLYPVILLTANVVYYLHMPYCVIHFAVSGHTKIWGQLRAAARSRSKAATVCTAT